MLTRNHKKEATIVTMEVVALEDEEVALIGEEKVVVMETFRLSEIL